MKMDCESSARANLHFVIKIPEPAIPPRRGPRPSGILFTKRELARCHLLNASFSACIDATRREANSSRSRIDARRPSSPPREENAHERLAQKAGRMNGCGKAIRDVGWSVVSANTAI